MRHALVIDCAFPPRSRGPLLLDGWDRFDVLIDGERAHTFDALTNRKPVVVLYDDDQVTRVVEVHGGLPPPLRVEVATPPPARVAVVSIRPATQLSPNGYGLTQATVEVETRR